MGIYQFTDNEYAVIMDSLAYQREVIKQLRPDADTPTIDTAIAKMNNWANPTGCEFIVATGEDAVLILSVTES